MESKFLRVLTECERQGLQLVERVLKLKYWTKSGDLTISESDYSKLFGQTQELITICKKIEKTLNWIDLKGKNNEQDV